MVFWCFQGDQNGILGRKGLIKLLIYELISLTLSCIMMKNKQIYIKNLALFTQQYFKVCLAVFQHYYIIYLQLYICWICSEYPANIYLFKVNNRNTRKMRELCSKLTTKTPKRRQWRRSGVFIFNFEHILNLFLVFLLLTLNK